MFDFLYSLIENFSEVIRIIFYIAFFSSGVFFLVKGADAFVKGAASLARKLHVPAVIVGMTVVSFGTSAPEASVSIASALSGNADIAVGNIVGSNICNILLVLGMSAVFVPIVIRKPSAFVDLLIMVITTIILLVMFLFFPSSGANGLIRWEGLILLIGIISYITYNIVKALKHKTAPETNEDEPKLKLWVTLVILIVGLAGVIIGGDFVTYGASSLAQTMGLSNAIVGLTIVAVCTSLPELVTTFVAARKKENDIALGNVIGSNIFNILFILGITAVITPIGINPKMIIDIIFALLLSLLVFTFYFFKGKITKGYAIMMITLYVSYLAFLVVTEIGLIAV